MSARKKNRWQEPSTWAGIAAIFAAIAPVAGPAAPVMIALSGVAGGVAVIKREGAPE